MRSRAVSPLIYAGVFLISLAALGQEILLTRILALMMWHHFTYVVIGVALLGFGAAGSYVMVRQVPEHDRPARRLARNAVLFALSSFLCYAMMIRVRFVPIAMAQDPNNLIALLLIYVLIALPFFFAGVVICDAIGTYAKHVGSIYFIDLVGAGLGALLVVTTMEQLTAPGGLVAMGAVGALAATCFALQDVLATRGARVPLVKLFGGVALTLAFAFGLVPYARGGSLDPPLAPSKEMAAWGLAGKIETSVWSPLARIDVTTSERTKPAMGGALPPSKPVMDVRGIFQDGAAPTLFLGWDGESDEELAFLKDGSAAAGHVALQARGVRDVEEMAIGVGGGVDLLIALQFGVKVVTGVEINAATVRLLEEDYAAYTGNLAHHPKVELVNAEGRHFARASGREFDLIQLSGVDTYTALSSGAYTLSESYLYTRQAVEEFLDALGEEGVLCYSRFLFRDEPRETLRLAATALEVLEERGVDEAHRHLFVLGGRTWASLLVSNAPFEAPERDALNAMAKRNRYGVYFDPAVPQENAFDDCLRRTRAQRQVFYRDYPYQVRPAEDDRPFFFNYYKWRGLWQEDSNYGGHAYRMKYPVGHLCLVVSLLQTLLLGAFFILRPLGRLGRLQLGGGTLACFLYFSALGIGFIALEVVLMQRFVLFLGHPTYSLTVVLPTMLVGAGFGSLTVRPGTDPRRRLGRLMVAVPVVILASWLFSTFGLDLFLGLGLAARVLISVAFFLPIGFVLGKAFPTGVQLVERHRPELVPWVWAINSFTTVLGSTGVVLVAMELGFTVVILATAPLYVAGIMALSQAFGRAPASGGAAGAAAD